MKNLCSSLVLFTLFSLHAEAQDGRLSQIWSLPSMMNPSLVGKTDEPILSGIGYSNQKTKFSQVQHQYAFLNGRFGKDYEKTGKAFGLGGTYYQYGSGNSVTPSPINAKFFSFTGAYHMRLSKDETHLLSIGAQFAFANATANEKGSFYDKEINGGGFRWTDMDSSGLRSNASGYMDINIGANYKYTGENIGIEAGVGAYHFTHPKMALITSDKETGLRGRMVFHGKIDILVSPTRNIVFNNIFWTEGLYWQSTALDLYTLVANWSGVELMKTNLSSTKFSMDYGMYTRSFKTVMPYLSAHPGNGINLRLSYEIPIASNVYQSYTAKRFELSLQYAPPSKGKGKRSYKTAKQREAKNAVDSVKTILLEDSDKDGVADSIDKCPDEAGPFTNLGCPLLDKDGDGVNDLIDKCPDQPGPPENLGCPNFMKNSSKKAFESSEEYYTSMINSEIIPKDTVQLFTFFDFNSSQLTQNSFVLLNKMVDFLKRNNEYRATIAGHSDNEGDNESNMKISSRRASVVKSYLGSYGIADVRMKSSFYGKTRLLPIYDKNLMWMNRRVELLLIKVK